jgi:hypothetical protein
MLAPANASAAGAYIIATMKWVLPKVSDFGL